MEKISGKKNWRKGKINRIPHIKINIGNIFRMEVFIKIQMNNRFISIEIYSERSINNGSRQYKKR